MRHVGQRACRARQVWRSGCRSRPSAHDVPARPVGEFSAASQLRQSVCGATAGSASLSSELAHEILASSAGTPGSPWARRRALKSASLHAMRRGRLGFSSRSGLEKPLTLPASREGDRADFDLVESSAGLCRRFYRRRTLAYQPAQGSGHAAWSRRASSAREPAGHREP